jgi:hypothetical protein
LVVGRYEFSQALTPEARLPTTVTNADDGQEATAVCTLFAVAKKEVPAASGTEVADEDIVGAKAGAKELRAIGLPEVEEDVLGRGLMTRGHHVEPLDRIGFIAGAKFLEPFRGFGKLGKELGGDFSTNFVAAAADGRANAGEEIRRLGFKVHLHLADCLDRDAGQRAAPAGVNGSDGMLFGVNEENGDAVSGLYAQEKPGAVSGQGITPARFGGHGVEKMDHVGMDLPEGNELEIGCAKGRLEKAAVLKDVFFPVPLTEAEIENSFAVQLADTAELGAEAVN